MVQIWLSGDEFASVAAVLGASALRRRQLNFNELQIEPFVARAEQKFAVHCQPPEGLHFNRIASN
jgi:hypothetical protein